MDTECLRKFNEIVQSVLTDRMVSDDDIARIVKTIPDVPCRDQYVGRIQKWTETAFEKRKFAFGKGPVEGNTVVLVLESPNDKEFVQIDGVWRSKGPARHCTGCHLREFWEDVFEDEYDGWNLYLVNAVRYQCSLSAARGVIKSLKDVDVKDIASEVICSCLTDSSKIFIDCLEMRLKRLLNRMSSRVVLVNASTKKGCGKYYRIISKVLLECVNDHVDEVYASNHPSSWWNSKHRTKARPLLRRN